MDEITSVLKELPQNLQTQIMSTALTTAAKPIVNAAKTFAPRRTGALRKSITSVVKKYQKGAVQIGIIGPDTQYYGNGKRLKKGASRVGADRPVNYAHLVEYGHVKRGDSGFVAAQPFMRPAVLAAASTTGETLAQGIAKGIEKTRAKLIKKGLHAA